MRIDLSKVTLIQIETDGVDYDSFSGTRILYATSNRIHTLLRQSDHRFTTTANMNVRSGGEIRPEISKLTFLNVFDNHSPEDIEKLDRLYEDCKGALPSRRQLSAIAQSIGIQQSKIKKWFEKRIRESQKAEPSRPTDSVEDSQFWDEIWAKMDQIDDQISAIESKKNKPQ